MTSNDKQYEDTRETFRLYIKYPRDSRFRPVDWNHGMQVSNLIHATLFTREERDRLEAVDLLHPGNQGFEWKFRRVEW